MHAMGIGLPVFGSLNGIMRQLPRTVAAWLARNNGRLRRLRAMRCRRRDGSAEQITNDTDSNQTSDTKFPPSHICAQNHCDDTINAVRLLADGRVSLIKPIFSSARNGGRVRLGGGGRVALT